MRAQSKLTPTRVARCGCLKPSQGLHRHVHGVHDIIAARHENTPGLQLIGKPQQRNHVKVQMLPQGQCSSRHSGGVHTVNASQVHWVAQCKRPGYVILHSPVAAGWAYPLTPPEVNTLTCHHHAQSLLQFCQACLHTGCQSSSWAPLQAQIPQPP